VQNKSTLHSTHGFILRLDTRNYQTQVLLCEAHHPQVEEQPR